MLKLRKTTVTATTASQVADKHLIYLLVSPKINHSKANMLA